MPTTTLGVGFVGAGPVTPAIHLPTLAHLPEAFDVVHITDIDPEISALGRSPGRCAVIYPRSNNCLTTPGS